MPGRRAFLKLAGATLGAAAGTGLYTWRVEPHWLEIVRRPLPVRRLPARLRGATVALLSDIHVGTRVDDEYLLSVFARVAALRPDITLFAGDFINYHAGVFDQAAAVYRHFPRGRLGTFATLGNHDYGLRWSRLDIAAHVVRVVEAVGITVLRNETRDVEGLQIVGLDDWWSGQFQPHKAFDRFDFGRATIVLSHNPDTADLPAWSGYDGWILAGHTHGGQCKPPFLPPPLLPVENRRYTSGEFALDGGRSMYISRGVGHLMRVRFNVRPEVTLFELRDA